MKNVNRILWGFVLVGVGVVLGLHVMDILPFDIFFKGWWTLIIIIPSFISLFSQRDKTPGIVGMVAGVLLLLGSRGIIDFKMLAKLIGPILIVVIGLCLIFKDTFNRNAKEAISRIKEKNFPKKKCTAVFGGKNAVFTGEPFYGADAVAAFGALEIDLRGSVITEDIIISTGAVFGGVDIFLPQNVNAELCVTPVFGGVANKTGRPFTPGIPTVFVTGVCAFGGIDVK